MGFLSGIFRTRDAPQNRTAGSNYAFYLGGSTAGKIVTERSAMQMTAVYSCVRILSEAIAELPLHVYKYTDSGGKEKATDHPLYLLLHDEPNPEMSSFVFRETLMTHLLLWGNAYAQIIRNGKGEVVALYPLMPNKMSVDRDENGQLYYRYNKSSDEAATMPNKQLRQLSAARVLAQGNAYVWLTRDGAGHTVEMIPIPEGWCHPRYSYDQRRWLYYAQDPKTGQPYVLDPADVIHYKGFSLNGVTGLSKLERARRTIETGQLMEQYQNATYKNGGRPSGALTIDTDLGGTVQVAQPDGTTTTENRRDVVRREWEKYTGAGNAFRTAILDNGLKYEAISVTNADAQFVENKSLCVEDICRFFCIPSYKLGIGKLHLDDHYLSDVLWRRPNEIMTPNTVILHPRDVLHIPGLGFDGLVGYSPIAMAKNAIGLAIATEEYGAKFFANGAAPSGVLEHPGTIKDPSRVREAWQSQFGGSSNSGKVAVLEEGMKYTPISISPEQAQFLETRKFQINEIARIFRVPPHMVGDLEKSSFSNIEQQSLEFVKYTLDPWVTRWEQSIQRSLLSPDEKKRYFVKFNVEGLLRGDYASRMQGYATARQNGWMSANDIRELENLDRIPAEDGGDLYLINGNMLPLVSAGAFANTPNNDGKEDDSDEEQEVLEMDEHGGRKSLRRESS